MFDLVIKIHPYDLEQGVDSYSTANLTINGKNGSLTSKREEPPYQDMMIFISISELLDKVVQLVKNQAKDYQFNGVDSSFVFNISNRNGTFYVKDSKHNLIAECTPVDLVKSIWLGVSKIVNKYRPFLENDDGVTKDLDMSIKEFKTEFSNIL